MLKTLSIIFVAFFIEGALSQAILAGPCPEIAPVKDFDYENMNGVWYKLGEFPGQNLLLNNTKCRRTTITVVGNQLEVNDFGLSKVTGEEQTAVVNATALGEGSIYFPLGIGPVDAVNSWIIAIDSEKYMSSFTCINLNPQMHATLASVFLRNKHESEETIAKAFAPFAALGLYPEAFTPTDQTDCPSDKEKKSRCNSGYKTNTNL